MQEIFPKAIIKRYTEARGSCHLGKSEVRRIIEDVQLEYPGEGTEAQVERIMLRIDLALHPAPEEGVPENPVGVGDPERDTDLNFNITPQNVDVDDIVLNPGDLARPGQVRDVDVDVEVSGADLSEGKMRAQGVSDEDGFDGEPTWSPSSVIARVVTQQYLKEEEERDIARAESDAQFAARSTLMRLSKVFSDSGITTPVMCIARRVRTATKKGKGKVVFRVYVLLNTEFSPTFHSLGILMPTKQRVVMLNIASETDRDAIHDFESWIGSDSKLRDGEGLVPPPDNFNDFVVVVPGHTPTTFTVDSLNYTRY